MAKDTEGTNPFETLDEAVRGVKKEFGKQKDRQKHERTLQETLYDEGKGALAAGIVGGVAGIPLPIIGPVSGFLAGAGGYLGYKALKYMKRKKDIDGAVK